VEMKGEAMKAAEDLEQEHRIIEVILPAVERVGGEADRGRLSARGQAEEILRFLGTFVDGCHHGKEERHLFKKLEERGVPRNEGLVFELLKEHGEGRRYVRGLRAALEGAANGETAAAKAFGEHARGYGALLRRHIEKEDTRLWPLVEETLSAEDDRELMGGYAEVERDTIGEGGREEYARRARELAEGGR
jgi:hemerythrin-like domain-containing protein